EEQLFESFNFPETSEHKKQHQKFIFFIEDRVKEKNSKNETDFLEKLINFLKKWLFSHILNEDKKYQKFLQNRNIDAAPVFKKLLNSGETRLSRKQITIYNYVADNSDLIEAREKNETTYIYKLWKTYSLSTDIPILDIQHLWLIKIIVELEQGIQTNDNKKRELQFQKSIYQAIEYSKYHFYTEELIMKEFNYPALDTHVSYHRKFTSFLGFRLKQKKEGIYSAIYGLVSDLKEWLISHIAIEDKKLLSFYKDKEEELSIFIKKMIQENKLQIENEHLRLYANILKKEK
ncbi:MAG: hypothetical protein KDK45_22355, partial [Leptospiraceae bacterium]|nr:hypothetical protein [Leptospiraceae bacterium]